MSHDSLKPSVTDPRSRNCFRREFLVRAGSAIGVVLGFGFATGDAFAGKKKGKKHKKSRPRLYDMQHTHFEDLVGDQFTVHGPRGSTSRKAGELILKEVEILDYDPRAKLPAHLQRKSFLLVFVARGHHQLEEGIHRVAHARFGEFDLSLHPLHIDGEHWLHYSAVFT